MPDTFFQKTILIVIYLAIIVMIPLFLDYLFNITVRRKRKMKIKRLAEQKAKETGKALVIFNDRYNGIVHNINDGQVTKEAFAGDIVEIVNQMANNSCVMIISETFEYINGLKEVIDQIRLITNGDFYAINVEKNSLRVFWDYKIIQIMDKSYYAPSSQEIKWTKPNGLQRKIEKFYSYVFKVFPYKFLVNDPIEKV